MIVSSAGWIYVLSAMSTLDCICTQPAACSLQPAVSTFCPGRLTTSHCTSMSRSPTVNSWNRQKPEKNPFTHHIAEDITWFFLEHLIKKLFDSFWNFILVKISHSFAFFLQTVRTIFYRHLESPRQLKSFTAASLWCTWSLSSQFLRNFLWHFYETEDVCFKIFPNTY